MSNRVALIILPMALAAAGCGTSTEPEGGQSFVIEVSGEQFRIQATDPPTIAELERRRQEGIEGVVIGDLVSGDGGFNDRWSWHLDPPSVRAPDLAIELCDGRPSMVEADLTYWLNQVKAFCPWGATVVSGAQ